MNITASNITQQLTVFLRYAVSILATNALGIDRTYFAAELGLVEPKWITQVTGHTLNALTMTTDCHIIVNHVQWSQFHTTLITTDFISPRTSPHRHFTSQFPYGYIPHPMIVSQVWAMLGLYKAAHFRAEAPYVVPLHVALYLVHMLQEHFDVYKRYPENEVAVVPQNILGAHDKEVMSKYHYLYKANMKNEEIASTTGI